jgi:hypothetical protein
MRKPAIIVAVLAVIVGMGIAIYVHYAPTPIGKIMAHPRDYESSETRIAGKVTSRASMLLVRYFTLEDGTGEITVITDRALPNIGEKVRVRGRVVQAFALGSLQTTVFRESGIE